MASRKRSRPRRRAPQLDIPAKAGRVLSIILAAMLMIVLRIWHLGVVQHDERVEIARRPQVRRVFERAERGTIRDRFGLPLAVNRVQYNASVCYAQIREVPRIIWKKAPDGTKTRCYRRREYIRELSDRLATELPLSSERIEDLIHSKAALYQHLPYKLSEDIGEEAYYRLKSMEREWPGVVAERAPKRYYPREQVAASVLGYMGAINRTEYESIVGEMRALEGFLREEEAGLEPQLPSGFDSIEELRDRVTSLQERAYTINDYLGKTGVEGFFEERLRGYQGQRFYESDARGNFLKELPGGHPPAPGSRVHLAISTELQEYAESLLIENERIRDGRSQHRNPKSKQIEEQRQAWVKGGSIVAMDPKTGEVLALASYPRFNPNDFVVSGDPIAQQKKRSDVNRWLESQVHLAELWDQRRPLKREGTKATTEEVYLTWPAFLEFILPAENPVRLQIESQSTLGDAIAALQALEGLLDFSGQESVMPLINYLYPASDGHVVHGDRALSRKKRAELEKRLDSNRDEITELTRQLSHYVGALRHNYDKVLLLDLYHLAVDTSGFNGRLLEFVGDQELKDYRQHSVAYSRLKEVVRSMTADIFHDADFASWRARHQKSFLKEKRRLEAEAETYQRPYLDYLDREEREQFADFWRRHGDHLLCVLVTGRVPRSLGSLDEYTNVLRDCYFDMGRADLNTESWASDQETLSKAVQQLPIELVEAYLESMRGYDDLSRPLYGRYRQLRFEEGVQLERHLASAYYPVYGFGYCRSYAYSQGMALGSLFKLVTGYTALLQEYERLLEKGKELRTLNPLEIVDQLHRDPGKTGWMLGYFSNGESIPQHYNGGRLIRSASRNLGKVDFTKAMERSSNPYFSLLASDVLEDPDDLSRAAQLFSFGSRTGVELTGEMSGRVPTDLGFNQSGLYAFAIGQHSFVATPLQAAVMLSGLANGGQIYRPQMLVGEEPDLRREAWMPAEVRDQLWGGMRKSALRTQSRSIYNLYRFYEGHAEGVRDLAGLKGQLIGKSSTAEMLESVDLDRERGRQNYNHIWYGGVVFSDSFSQDPSQTPNWDAVGEPELVIVVFLRFGGYGYEAAPLAAQVATKWRDIKLAHSVVDSL